jgi:hypothetical protein
MVEFIVDILIGKYLVVILVVNGVLLVFFIGNNQCFALIPSLLTKLLQISLKIVIFLLIIG